ncbi:secreted phosphoprotein 24-like isoform X1 [Conger conger]|uniref:secreted phosphoprotein 24-like isoform X1 n=1 Tax=Conger conger TaxID=82655 RepID=UPI002A5AC32E|nr:secreted phosphoprotein 24-like isoform X1 [Conger conger]
MKVAILSLVLLQCLCCSGRPPLQVDLAPAVQKAASMSLARVNTQSSGANLYRITHSSLKKVIPVGINAHDLMLNFRIRETVCPKASDTDPEKCNFKLGFFVATASCSSRVRVSSGLSELVSLRCSRSDSSSSSSESNSGEALRWLSGMSGQSHFGIGAGPVNTPTQRTAVDNHLGGNGMDNFMQ